MLIEQCKIIRNEEIAGGIWEMEFSAPGIVSYYTGPGQFLEILLDNKWRFTVRRPMSIANVEEKHITPYDDDVSDLPLVAQVPEPAAIVDRR